jgi:GNAT superfamily N-acetyltransferase
VGLLAAQIITPHFSNDRVAMEWLWYVEPEYRGKDSIQLLKAYLYWAFDVMKCDHATMSTLDSALADKLHKLYTKIGFSKQENTYIIGRS